MLVIGDREQEAGAVSVREHRQGDAGSTSVDALIERLKEEVQSRSKGLALRRYTR